MTDSSLTIRLATDLDVRGLRRLAALDTAPFPAEPVLLATECGRLVAALSLADGRAVADPFVPSAGTVEVLRARAAQIRANQRVPARAG